MPQRPAPHEEAHQRQEALVRDGLLQRVITADGRTAYRPVTRRFSDWRA